LLTLLVPKRALDGGAFLHRTFSFRLNQGKGSKFFSPVVLA
jgi:hypothetical protein